MFTPVLAFQTLVLSIAVVPSNIPRLPTNLILPACRRNRINQSSWPSWFCSFLLLLPFSISLSSFNIPTLVSSISLFTGAGVWDILYIYTLVLGEVYASIYLSIIYDYVFVCASVHYYCSVTPSLKNAPIFLLPLISLFTLLCTLFTPSRALSLRKLYNIRIFACIEQTSLCILMVTDEM